MPSNLPADLADLPLTEAIIAIAGRGYRVTAARDQDALLAATAGHDQVPFGLMLWESAVVLAEALATQATMLRGCHVLELGAGVGLAGLVAASQGAQVVQADHDRAALQVCAHNAHRNDVSAHTRQSWMDWHTWQPTARFDLIIGADIVYDAADHASVARVLEAALAPGGRVLLADPDRPGTGAFLQRLHDTGWTVDVARHAIADLTVPTRMQAVHLIAGQRA